MSSRWMQDSIIHKQTYHQKETSLIFCHSNSHGLNLSHMPYPIQNQKKPRVLSNYFGLEPSFLKEIAFYLKVSIAPTISHTVTIFAFKRMAYDSVLSHTLPYSKRLSPSIAHPNAPIYSNVVHFLYLLSNHSSVLIAYIYIVLALSMAYFMAH